MGENLGPNINAAVGAVAALATLAVALRLVARNIKGLGLHIDDYLIIASLPLAWGMVIVTIIAVHYGLGRHIYNIPSKSLLKEGHAFWVSELVYVIPIPFIKISILALYVRIFGHLRYFRVAAYSLGVFTICWAIMVFLVCAFQCKPIEFAWNKTIQGTCINSELFFVIGSAPNVFTDFIVLILPLPAVWALKTSRFQKVSLLGIFMLGGLTCAISLVRLIELAQLKGKEDVTWWLSYASIWSCAEICLGIVSACLPTFRPLFDKVTRKQTSNGSHTYQGYSRSGFRGLPAGSNDPTSVDDSSFQKLHDSSHLETQIVGDKNRRKTADIDEVPLNAISVRKTTTWNERVDKLGKTQQGEIRRI